MATITVNVSAINDAPVVDLNGPETGINFTAAFTEDSGPTSIVASAALTVSDADDGSLTSATIQLAGAVAAESLSVDVSGTSIIPSYDSGTGILTLTGSDTLVHYQQVLRTLKYDNVDQDLTAGARSITVVVSDGDQSSAVATITQRGGGQRRTDGRPQRAHCRRHFAANYTAGGAAVAITGATASVNDLDNDLTSLTATITNLQDGESESLSVDITGTPITADYDDVTGVLTLSGVATVGSVPTGSTHAQIPEPLAGSGTGCGVITVVVNDGIVDSLPATATVTVQATGEQNLAPDLQDQP